MAFDDDTFRQFLRLARERPEWHDELRRLILTEELLAVPERLVRLEALLERLAEAQTRTEERLERLAEAQARTEERLERLVESQARTEERLERLEAAVDRLAEAQVRTEEQLLTLVGRGDRLEGELGALRREVGRLAEGVSADAELEAQRVLARLFPEQGYRVLERFRPLALDGEVDVVTRVEDPRGETFSVLLEAKFRLQRGDVTGWRRRVRDKAVLARLRAEGLEPPFLAYAFGLRVYGGAERAGHETGIGILDAEGEVVAPVPWSPGPQGR